MRLVVAKGGPCNAFVVKLYLEAINMPNDIEWATVFSMNETLKKIENE
jgi:hypothetical protein